MNAARTRHGNHGLRKRCRCKRSKWPKCPHGYHFNYKWNGVHYRISLNKHLHRRVEGKIEAQRAARDLRTEIEENRFGVALPARETLTVAQLLAAYVKEHLTAERPRGLAKARYQVKVINATRVDLITGEERAFGECLVRDIGTGALEKFRAARRTQTVVTTTDCNGRKCARRKGGAPTTNRDLSLLRAAFNWAIRLGYTDATPFKRFTETVVKLTKEASRRRRLEGDEAERLLQACDPLLKNPKTKVPFFDQPPPRLRPIVEAALATGCRRGELLSLQWDQVKDLDGTDARIDLPAAKTKTKRDRVVPIANRLKAILEMRRNGPDGTPHGPKAYVFGNEIGQRIGSIKTAWALACKRAKIVDLRFHDLRREAGSRWLDAGVPLQTIRDWLGHANISQTSTYLESTLKGQHEAMRRFDQTRAVSLQQASLDQAAAAAGAPPATTDALCNACATEGGTQGSADPRMAQMADKKAQGTIN